MGLCRPYTAGHWYSFLDGGTLERSPEVTMNRITVTIPDDRLSKLQEIAARFQITPEDLIRVSIDELLARPEENFRQAAEYVLNKNSELYRRLA